MNLRNKSLVLAGFGLGSMVLFFILLDLRGVLFSFAVFATGTTFFEARSLVAEWEAKRKGQDFK